MATETLTSVGFNTASPLNQTQTKEVKRLAVIEQRNVAQKPVTLYGIIVDNQVDTASAKKAWVRLYDDPSDSWDPQNTKSIIGFPVEAFGSIPQQSIGSYQVMFSRTGIVFERGISVAASLGDGANFLGGEITSSSTDPQDLVAVELIHS